MARNVQKTKKRRQASSSSSDSSDDYNDETAEVEHAPALATCMNYAELNNSMLRMCYHISGAFSRCNSKVNTGVFVILLQVCGVNFLIGSRF